MKLLLLMLMALSIIAPASAQLALPNHAGVAMGHVHLNVQDAELHKRIWINHFAAQPLDREGLTGVKIPGALILFRQQEPTGNAEGTALDHFGMKVRNLADTLERWRAAGYEVPREFKGSEGFPNAYVVGPDGVRFELQQDVSLPAEAAAQHLHYRFDDHLSLQNWYVQTLGAEVSKRSWHDSAELPGINLTLDPLRRPRNSVPTKGRVIDHVGFEVRDLEAFCKQLEAKGIVFDISYRENPELGIAAAFLTDPSGVYIELTEGLREY